MNYTLIANHESEPGIGVQTFVNDELTEQEIVIVQIMNSKIHDALIDCRYRNNEKAIAEHIIVVERLKSCFPSPLIYVKEIPNEHNNDVHNPWLLVTTCKGIIKIGWRHSVIKIDWSESDIVGLGKELFYGEDTSIGERYIHAWGYEKCKRYLDTLIYGG